jgi:hypothetical protein
MPHLDATDMFDPGSYEAEVIGLATSGLSKTRQV